MSAHRWTASRDKLPVAIADLLHEIADRPRRAALTVKPAIVTAAK